MRTYEYWIDRGVVFIEVVGEQTLENTIEFHRRLVADPDFRRGMGPGRRIGVRRQELRDRTALSFGPGKSRRVMAFLLL